MTDWKSPDGAVFSWLDKIGQLILLSLSWLIGCLPVVTIVSSTTALYYAVIKSVRRGRGDALKEFWRSYRDNLRRGIPITVLSLTLGALLSLNLRYCLTNAGQVSDSVTVANVLALALLAMLLVFICPILSRFDLRVKEVWKLSFVMAVRFLPYTILLGAGCTALVLLQIYVLPMPTLLILPSAWCFVTTYPVEKALRKFMPEKKPEDDAWYYE